MESKVAAVKKALELSVSCLISSKDLERPVLDALCSEGEGTFFYPRPLPKMGRNKLWLASIKETDAFIDVDAGAVKALRSNKSLLSSGIIDVSGEFSPGDCVNVLFGNEIIGRGIVSFAHSEIELIKGKHSSEIQDLLGPGRDKEVIHVEKFVLDIEE